MVNTQKTTGGNDLDFLIHSHLAGGSRRRPGSTIEPRSLPEIRLIYYGCAGFGQILRSFLFNRPHYSPQTIGKSDSNQYTLVTIANLGPAPRFSMASGQLEVRFRGHSCFTSAAPLCKPNETLSTSPPRGFSAACHGMICQAPRVELPCI